MSYYFYFARCSDDSLYAGYCKDVHAREEKHNTGKGAKYTRSRLPIKIIYTEEFDTQRAAMQREIEVKKWNREKKLTLIQNQNGVRNAKSTNTTKKASSDALKDSSGGSRQI